VIVIDYLLACGWTRNGSFAGGGGDRWVDPVIKSGYAMTSVYQLDQAERIQLDRDAARRDYVNAKRPTGGSK